MSLSKSMKERIFLYIMEDISSNKDGIAKRVSSSFGVSLTTVYRHINELVDRGFIKKTDSKSCKYKLVSKKESYTFKNVSALEEDIIYAEHFRDHFVHLPYNIQKIWEYAVTEMLNNSIEHSRSQTLYCSIEQNYLYSQVGIVDTGIGVFENIRQYFEFKTVDDAVAELFKGKLTTYPERHSGEGIFFTSKIMDIFALWANGKIFEHTNYKDTTLNISEIASLQAYAKHSKHNGTTLLMRLSNFSQKNLLDVFDKYSSDEGGLYMTSIPIGNVYENGYPVSRSQAKRLYNRLEEFREVILDFKNVESIGQGFAHELFVVFQKTHPSTELKIENASAEVQKMINHVLASQ